MTSKEYSENGDKKRDSGDFKGAIADYTKVIELDPNYEFAYFDRGTSKLHCGDFKGAIADFTKVIELEPNYEFAYYKRGTAKFESGDFKGAIADYTKVIELEPNYEFAYYRRGVSKSNSGEYKGALDDYSKAIELDIDFAEAYYGRGFEKAMQLDYNGAIADCTKAIALDPNEALAYWNRVIAKIGLKDYRGVYADFTKAVQIDPDYAAICNNKGDTSSKGRDSSICERYWFFHACLEIDKLGIRTEDEDKANEYANQIIQICDSFNKKVKRFYVYIYDLLCDALIEKKNYVLAINEIDAILQHLIDDNPRVWKYYEKKARLYLKLGDIKKAINNFKKAIELCNDIEPKTELGKETQKLIASCNIEHPKSKK
jgi:tetratricopeptide (TPR) repeat protein